VAASWRSESVWIPGWAEQLVDADDGFARRQARGVDARHCAGRHISPNVVGRLVVASRTSLSLGLRRTPYKCRPCHAAVVGMQVGNEFNDAIVRRKQVGAFWAFIELLAQDRVVDCCDTSVVALAVSRKCTGEHVAHQVEAD